MDLSQIPEPLRARKAELEARSAVEKVRALLQSYVADTDGINEIRDGFATTAQYNAYFLTQDLAALEAVLTQDLPPGALFRLVSVDGSWPLDDDPTDAGAAGFLRELAGMVRDAIDEAERG